MEQLYTRWGRELNKEMPLSEYPRPQMVRDSYVCLNGIWDFEIDREAAFDEEEYSKKESLEKKIVVPFVPESKASGIEDTAHMKKVWYTRTFNLPESFDLQEGRVLFHIGACDYHTKVWVNNALAGLK